MEVLGLVILSFLIVLAAAIFVFFGITAAWGTPLFVWIAWIVLVGFVVLFLVSLLAQLGRGHGKRR